MAAALGASLRRLRLSEDEGAAKVSWHTRQVTYLQLRTLTLDQLLNVGRRFRPLAKPFRCGGNALDLVHNPGRGRHADAWVLNTLGYSP